MKALVAMAYLVSAAPALAEPSVYDRSKIADWTKPPPPTVPTPFVPPGATHAKLANGIELVVIPNRTLPLVSMMLVVRNAGASHDAAGKSGLAAFTADLLDEGAGGVGAMQLAEEQQRLGAKIETEIDHDSAYVTVSTLASSLADSLDLVTKIVTKPAFDASELDRVKGDRATALDLRRDRPREVAAIVVDRVLYGANGYGQPVDGTREDFKTITREDVQTFYRTHYQPLVMTLVVAGDVDAAALKKLLDARLGAWKPAEVKYAPASIPRFAKNPPRLLLVDRPGAAQSNVRVGIAGPLRKDKRYFAFEVMQTVLGGGFTGRITQTLREKMGIIYHAYMKQDWRDHGGPFVLDVAIDTPETARGIQTLIAMYADLSKTDVPAAELEKSKQNLIRALPFRFDTNATTAATFADLAIFGIPDAFYATYATNIGKIRAADVRAAAQTLLPGDQLVFAVVGDLSKIQASLEKLDLGKPVMFDAHGGAK